MPISESDLSRTSSVQYRADAQPGPGRGRRAIANTQTAVQKLDTALNPFLRPSWNIPSIPADAQTRLRGIRIKAIGPAQIARNWFNERYDGALIDLRRTLVSPITLGDIADLEPGTCTACLGTGECPACQNNDPRYVNTDSYGGEYCALCDGYQQCIDCDGTGREDGVAR